MGWQLGHVDGTSKTNNQITKTRIIEIARLANHTECEKRLVDSASPDILKNIIRWNHHIGFSARANCYSTPGTPPIIPV